jgi:DNA-binding NarL/FixJ family response regulator
VDSQPALPSIPTSPVRNHREHLVGAVRTVAAGGSLLDPKATSAVLERLRRQGSKPADPRYESLSPQERRILELIAAGLTNRQIGAELYLAEKTVKNYVSSLLHKLDFSRRTEAAVYAAERRSARTSGR